MGPGPVCVKVHRQPVVIANTVPEQKGLWKKVVDYGRLAKQLNLSWAHLSMLQFELGITFVPYES